MGKNWGKVEATFQVAPKKGWLEISKTLNVYISASRAARAILTSVLESSNMGNCFIFTLYEMILEEFGIGGFSYTY